MFADDQVGERIKLRRAQLKMSQHMLSASVGIATPQLYQYESGRTKPRPDMIGRLASALLVRVDWLACGNEPMLENESHSHENINQVEFNIPVEAYSKLKQVAQDQNTSISELIKQILLEKFNTK